MYIKSTSLTWKSQLAGFVCPWSLSSPLYTGLAAYSLFVILTLQDRVDLDARIEAIMAVQVKEAEPEPEEPEEKGPISPNDPEAKVEEEEIIVVKKMLPEVKSKPLEVKKNKSDVKKKSDKTNTTDEDSDPAMDDDELHNLLGV